MKEFIIQNIEVIITFVTMIVTWLFGRITKKSDKIPNNLIPIQNAVIMIISVIIYYYATGDFSSVVATGSPVATLIYDVVHTYNKSKEDEIDKEFENEEDKSHEVIEEE